VGRPVFAIPQMSLVCKPAIFYVNPQIANTQIFNKRTERIKHFFLKVQPLFGAFIGETPKVGRMFVQQNFFH
jgi:hypothetical protein